MLQILAWAVAPVANSGLLQLYAAALTTLHYFRVNAGDPAFCARTPFLVGRHIVMIERDVRAHEPFLRELRSYARGLQAE